MLKKISLQTQTSFVQMAYTRRCFAAAQQKRQLNLMLFGAPGVGKGTYSKLIEKEFDIVTFSMGDYFRGLLKEEKPGDPFLQNLRTILKEGKFVDDKLVVDIVNKVRKEDRLAKHMGLILDGVPRTINQAQMLKDSGLKVDLIIDFFNRDEILLQKLNSRRVCPKCNRNYNIADINTPDGYKMKPLLPKKKHDECDDCPGQKLEQREDDKDAVILDRLKLYKDKTAPILEFYKKSGDTKVVAFEAKKGVDDYPAVKQILKDALKI